MPVLTNPVLGVDDNTIENDGGSLKVYGRKIYTSDSFTISGLQDGNHYKGTLRFTISSGGENCVLTIGASTTSSASVLWSIGSSLSRQNKTDGTIFVIANTESAVMVDFDIWRIGTQIIIKGTYTYDIDGTITLFSGIFPDTTISGLSFSNAGLTHSNDYFYLEENEEY